MIATKYKKYFALDKIILEIKSYLPVFDEKKFLEAFGFAAKAHDGQLRKDGVSPYITHPIATVKILMSLRADEAVLTAALLHDVPEDTVYSLRDIEENFGEEVAFLVDGITKLSKVQYQNNMSERAVESLKKLFLHSARDLRVILIKLADRLHNMRTLQYVDKPEKRVRIASETLEIYVPIANLLGISFFKTELEDLCFQYLFPDEWQKLLGKFVESRKKHRADLFKFIAVLCDGLRKNRIKAEIKERKKGLYRAYKRICAAGKTIDGVKDRVSVRITVNKIAQCYAVLGVLHSLFKPNLKSFKDYIAAPKPNGYKSLHTLVFGVNGVLTEVQIQTDKMYLEAQFGVAANYWNPRRRDSLKNSLNTTDERSAWLGKIIDAEQTATSSENFLEDLKLDILHERIFTFTPKGQTIDLPKGATVIDFAYAIHTVLGDKAEKAEINGNIFPITTELKTGDVIKIITSNAVKPELYWLSFAKTALARKRIAYHLRLLSREEKMRSGREMLQKSFDLANMGFCESINFKRAKPFLNKEFKTNIQCMNDLFECVGEGMINPVDVTKLIRDIRRRKAATESGVERGNLDVHLKVSAKNRFGLMKDVYRIIYKHSLDINYFKAWTTDEKHYAHFDIEIVVDDIPKISAIVAELEQFEDVNSVYRIYNKGVFTFYLLSFFTAILWLAHPILLNNKALMWLVTTRPVISKLVIFMGILMLLFSLLYLTRVLNRYFPLLRNKSALWATSSALIVLASGVILFELEKLNFGSSWILVFGAILLAYFYLGASYLKFNRKI